MAHAQPWGGAGACGGGAHHEGDVVGPELELWLLGAEPIHHDPGQVVHACIVRRPVGSGVRVAWPWARPAPQRTQAMFKPVV